MAHKEKIDDLLLSLRELEKLVAGMRDMEIYPASFFGRCFSLSHRIINDLHNLETQQLDELGRQIEEHRRLIESIPRREIAPQPAGPVPVNSPCAVPEEPAVVPSEEMSLEPPAAPNPEVSAPLLSEVAAISKTKRETEIPPEPETEPETIREPETLSDIKIPVPENPLPADRPASMETAGSPPAAPGMNSREIPMARTRPIVSPQLTIGEKPSISLNEVLEKKNLSDFRKAFSLNDRFRFRRELFGGDEEKMNRAVRELNELHTFEDSIAYLHNQLQWNVEDAAVADFIQLLEKRFS